MKKCGICYVEKSLDSFYALPHTKDGLNYRCIPCQNQYNREYNRKKALSRIDPALISTLKAIPYEYQTRFLRLIRVSETGCWNWTGNTHPKSQYGRFWVSRHTDRLAHRLAYEWSGQDIPEGLVIDHLCRNRICVNPSHMQPVTLVENVMRGESVWAVNARKTHCLRGHEFTAENTWISKRNERHCRECTRIRKREARARRRLSGSASGGPLGR